MRKKLLYLVAFVCSLSMSTMAQDSTATCNDSQVFLTLYDQYDDGWGYYDGTQSSLTIDGVDYTIDGGSESFVLCLDLTTCTDVLYTPANGYYTENSWDIVDSNAVVFASGGYNSGTVGDCGVLGCMDASACNYDALATTDNGCTYAAEGFDCAGDCLSGDAVVYTAGSYAGEQSFTITDCDGAVLAEMTSGVDGFASCLELPAIYSVNMFDVYNDGWDGATLTVAGIVYDAESVYNVGSCPVYGCTDSTAANYNVAADTDDASCTYGIPGCTDASACNFDELATADDNSCTFALTGLDCNGNCLSGVPVAYTVNGSYSYPSENSFTITDCDGTVLAEMTSGTDGFSSCVTLSAIYSVNLTDSYGDSWNGNTLTIDGVVYDQPTTVTGGASDTYNVGECPVLGCMDETAFNYDSLAVGDDGSCEAVAYGCIDPTAENFSADANTTDESCTYLAGCTDATADNWNADAVQDDGSCTYTPGCTDNEAINFNPAASEDDGSCQYVVCLQTAAIFTLTTGSFGGEVGAQILDSNGQVLNDILPGTLANATAYSYDLCISDQLTYTISMIDSYGDGWNGGTFTIATCDGVYVAASGGLLAGSEESIDFSVTSCDAFTFGCMDSIASNYDASANEDDGSCTYPGCTDAMYLEFDAMANLDDESCLTLVVDGCMDATASNYNMDANQEDGSCIIAVPCDSGLLGMVIYMEDSWGDGWNGNEYSLVNSIGDVLATGTIQTGSSAQDTLCVAADCYAISVGGGQYIGETSWSISTEFNGPSIANAGGADAVSFGLGSDGDCSSLLGCSDTYATNYSEGAILNDGSCEYLSSVTCEEAIAMDVNSSYSGAFNDQVWFSITLEGQQFVSADAVAAPGFFYVGEVAFMTACDSTGVSVDQGVLEAGTYFISVNNSSTWANGDGYVLTVNAAAVVDGCTDVYADNYNELANIDDASCLYPCEGIPSTMTLNSGSWGAEVYWELLDSIGMIAAYGGPYDSNTMYELPVCLTSGMDYTMNTYDSYGDGWNGGTYEVVATCGEDSLTSFTYIVANNGGASPSDGLSGTNGEDFALESTEVFTVVACADVMPGCMDETMFNYDSLANVSSGACEEMVYGCMDSVALSFNADANVDDASCVYGCDGEFVTVNVTTGTYATEVTWELLTALGDTLMFGDNLANNTPYSEQICLPIGDAFIFAAHDSYGDGWNGGSFSVVSCESIMEGGVEQVGDLPAGFGADYQFTVISCADIVPGCTNVLAENFNAEATHSNGSCVFTMPNILSPICGSTIDLATTDSIVYNWEALIGEGSAPAYYYTNWSTNADDLEGSVSIIGNTFNAADSLMYTDYDGLYNLFVDNGYGAGSEFSLYFWVSTDYYTTEGSSTQFANNGCQITLTLSELNGCNDASAINFDADATVNDGTCIYPCDSTFATLMMYDSYGDGWNGNEMVINGTSYTIDLGDQAVACVDMDTTSCVTFAWTSGSFIGETSWVIYTQDASVLAEGGGGTLPDNLGNCAYGCTNSEYAEYDENADVDDGSCATLLCAGDIVSLDLVDSYGDGWNGGIITVNGSDYTMASGSAISHGLCVDLSTCIDVTYTAGSYSGENSWSISDDAGNLLVDAGNVSGFVGDCGTFGCADPLATNFDELADNDDGSCYYEGCTDPLADNFDVMADTEDGSCVYSCADTEGQIDVLVTTDAYSYETAFTLSTNMGDEWNVSLVNNNNATVTTTFCVTNGAVVSFEITDTYEDGILLGGYQIYVCEESLITNLNFNTASATEEFMVTCGDIAGCMDATALNYNEYATIDDASCDYPFVCDGVTAEVAISTAAFGGEMGWFVSDADSNLVAGDDGAFGTYEDNSLYMMEICLVDGADYSFNMSDAFGDGWNGGTFAVTADCGTLAEGGLLDGSADAIAFTACGGSTDCEVPASWMVTITGANHTIMVPGDAAITVDDVQVADGSAIGVFFTNSNGDLQCAGYTVISGSTAQVAAMGDDTTTDEVDGLVAGEALTWMIWDGSTCTEVAATAIYSGGADVYTTNGITFVESIASVPAGPTCQSIDLPSGWSMFSTYMIAADMDLMTVLAPIVENVIIVKNNSGLSYLTEWQFNGIGELVVGQGYQIKTDAAVSLEMCGDYAFPEDNTISLSAGWNMIGYLRTEPSDALAVLADINATGNLIIAKDYSGAAYLPQWAFNGIGDMVPGDGYQIKITDADVLTFLSNDESYRISSVEVSNKAVSHFATVAVTDNNMTVVIEDAAWDVLPTAGAEIAAFDKAGNLIGSAVYASPLTVMAVWGDDATTATKDGLALTENVTFKVWSNNSTNTFEVSNWVEGSASYDVNAINVASEIVTNVLTDVIATERVLVKVVNVLGQEVISNEESFKGEILFNVYNDGTVEKIVK